MTASQTALEEAALDLDGVLAQLTVAPGKQALFHNDIAFRSGWRDWRRILGDEAVPAARRVGLLLLKPELLVHRRWKVVLDVLRHNELAVQSFAPVTLSRSMAQELWRYAWNNATVDRIDLAASMAAIAPSVVVFVTPCDAEAALPATLLLTMLKGSVDPARREGKEIRSVIPMTNKMIGFVHTSDEPADLIREIGVLFGVAERRRVVTELSVPCRSNTSEELAGILQYLSDSMECHDLDPVRSWRRIAEVLGADAARVEWAVKHDPQSVVELIRCLDTESRLSAWDAMCVVASAIRLDVAGREQLIVANELGSLASAWSGRAS
jgi:hypothetical protein